MSDIDTMVKTPKETPITNKPLITKLDHEAVLMDLDALANEAQSAPEPKADESMKKTWERINRYWATLEKEPTEFDWSNDRAKEDKVELLRRLTERRDDAHITVRYIYQAAIDHLKRKPEPRYDS